MGLVLFESRLEAVLASKLNLGTGHYFSLELARGKENQDFVAKVGA